MKFIGFSYGCPSCEFYIHITRASLGSFTEVEIKLINTHSTWSRGEGEARSFVTRVVRRGTMLPTYVLNVTSKSMRNALPYHTASESQGIMIMFFATTFLFREMSNLSRSECARFVTNRK